MTKSFYVALTTTTKILLITATEDHLLIFKSNIKLLKCLNKKTLSEKKGRKKQHGINKSFCCYYCHFVNGWSTSSQGWSGQWPALRWIQWPLLHLSLPLWNLFQVWHLYRLQEWEDLHRQHQGWSMVNVSMQVQLISLKSLSV